MRLFSSRLYARTTPADVVSSRNPPDLPGFDPMTIANLKFKIAKLRAKLTDPHDGDDKNWVGRWLKGCELRLSKKEKAFDKKQTSLKRRRRIEAISHVDDGA